MLETVWVGCDIGEVVARGVSGSPGSSKVKASPMTQTPDQQPFSFYKEHPKTCAPDDFWGQVKRTVNGEPVSEDQIQMIVDAVIGGLDLRPGDTLLDLCCGNGALTTRLFDRCDGGLGVDFSEALIKVAHENFERPPAETFVMNDVVEHVKTERDPDRFTKLLCYGSFAYLEAANAEDLLRRCCETYRNAGLMFIGNCPDKAQVRAFFRDRDYVDGIEDEPDSAIGIWRTREEFAAMADRAGWRATFSVMPEGFYARRYRYDVVLTRRD